MAMIVCAAHGPLYPAPTDEQATGRIHAIVRGDLPRLINDLTLWQHAIPYGVRQRCAGDDGAVDRHHASAQTRPELIAITVGRDHDRRGEHAAAGGVGAPSVSRALKRPDRAVSGDPCAG